MQLIRWLPVRNEVSTTKFPERTSAGIMLPWSETIICSQEFVEPGMANPNLKKRSSTSWPLRNMRWTNDKFSIFSFVENSIVRESSLTSRILFGKWTSMDFSSSSSSSRLSFYLGQIKRSQSISLVAASFSFIHLISNPSDILLSTSLERNSPRLAIIYY